MVGNCLKTFMIARISSEASLLPARAKSFDGGKPPLIFQPCRWLYGPHYLRIADCLCVHVGLISRRTDWNERWSVARSFYDCSVRSTRKRLLYGWVDLRTAR